MTPINSATLIAESGGSSGQGVLIRTREAQQERIDGERQEERRQKPVQRGDGLGAADHGSGYECGDCSEARDSRNRCGEAIAKRGNGIQQQRDPSDRDGPQGRPVTFVQRQPQARRWGIICSDDAGQLGNATVNSRSVS